MGCDRPSGSVRSHTHASQFEADRRMARICKRVGSATAFSRTDSSSAVSRVIGRPKPDGQHDGPEVTALSRTAVRLLDALGIDPY